MRVNVREVGAQCPECGQPVNVVLPLAYDAEWGLAHIIVEPCGHQVEFNATMAPLPHP